MRLSFGGWCSDASSANALFYLAGVSNSLAENSAITGFSSNSHWQEPKIFSEGDGISYLKFPFFKIFCFLLERGVHL